MKKIIVVVFLIFSGINWVSAQEWLTNFEEAKRIAQENDKNIILVFAGSDWCAPCIKLEKQILHTEEFQGYAKKHYVLLKADFPRKKKNQLPEALQHQNNALAEKYNKSGGFPLVVVLDKNGKKMGAIGYKKVTPNAYLEMLSTMIK
ncbi:thioredoxin-related protein [Aquimarina sp. EL_43]|uniref:thioredoxin family protein n=1 Tax=Aquimarina TaxID=290174 RepID=UPI0004718100|nr:MULTISPECIES: thioredoxin family protein [Aquimarina]MBG6128803.1 thioredoxin-related protein [Aquimarina sp. EL_35]MBG6149866.1 thioredoxin-related protein [Aquimarina sp. EL_32]MBG6167447.1 thioredoxin-related protein [Aquimarina sp. EL_43]